MCGSDGERCSRRRRRSRRSSRRHARRPGRREPGAAPGLANSPCRTVPSNCPCGFLTMGSVIGVEPEGARPERPSVSTHVRGHPAADGRVPAQVPREKHRDLPRLPERGSPAERSRRAVAARRRRDVRPCASIAREPSLGGSHIAGQRRRSCSTCRRSMRSIAIRARAARGPLHCGSPARTPIWYARTSRAPTSCSRASRYTLKLTGHDAGFGR
jgi:hypothetical protein